jgi:hypothetical protein
VGPLGLHPLVAFVPAFVVAIAWNTTLNRLWTFADLRRHHGDRRGYLATALVAGLVMFGCYGLLIALGWAPVAAGALAALVAAAINGLTNLPRVRRSPQAWSRLAADVGTQAGLDRIAEQLGAHRAYVVPSGVRAESHRLSVELVERAVRTRQALMATEAASFRPQRRTNIDLDSVIVVPVVRDGEAVAAVVLERSATRGFSHDDLETAITAVAGLGRAMDSSGDRLESAEAAAAVRGR